MQGDFFIDDWLIQPQINTVEKSGRTWHLEPKVMQVLVYLGSHPNQVLSKEKLIDSVWHDTFVGDDVLIRCISEIRYVFGDDPRSPSVIQTIPKSGYRLIASVRTEAGQLDAESADPKGVPHSSVEKKQDSIVTEPLDGIAAAYDAVISPEHTESVRLPELHPARLELPASHEPLRPSYRRRHGLLLLLATICILVAAAISWKATRPTPFEIFWHPVLSAREPALFCIADQNQYSFITLRDAVDPSHQVALKDNLSAIVIDDLDTIVKVAGALRAYGKEYQLKGEETTSLSDLRNGPSIFIGAFDNSWTLRFTKGLRYHFANNPDMTRFQIVDASNPSGPGWVVDRAQQMATNNYQDYAIVARFIDDTTGEPTFIVAGIGRGGTIAAGEFLTNSDYLAQLVLALKAAGNKKNIEIVLSTQIIGGQPGTPKVEAVHLW